MSVLQVQNEMLALVHLFMSGPIYKSQCMPCSLGLSVALQQLVRPERAYMCCLSFLLLTG